MNELVEGDKTRGKEKQTRICIDKNPKRDSNRSTTRNKGRLIEMIPLIGVDHERNIHPSAQNTSKTNL